MSKAVGRSTIHDGLLDYSIQRYHGEYGGINVVAWDAFGWAGSFSAKVEGDGDRQTDKLGPRCREYCCECKGDC